MKFARVCSHELWVPDSVAEWDAVAEDSPWEKERMGSILTTMQPGDVLYDIGAEHGWMSAIYGQRVGGENVVLVEPSPEFWPNIFMCWDRNNLGVPLATVEGFAGTSYEADVYVHGWPASASGPECGAMAYRHPNLHPDVKSTTIDYLAFVTGRPPKGITIDVEGAELRVLQGAASTLLDARPNVWVSVHPDLMRRDFDTSPEQLFTYMLEVGYTFRHLRTDHEQHWYFRPVEWDQQ
jgi:FkbM family methyltransferase